MLESPELLLALPSAQNSSLIALMSSTFCTDTLADQEFVGQCSHQRQQLPLMTHGRGQGAQMLCAMQQ